MLVLKTNVNFFKYLQTISGAVGDWYFDRSIVKLIDTSTDFPMNCLPQKSF